MLDFESFHTNYKGDEMNGYGPIKIFSGTSTKKLAAETCRVLSVPLSRALVGHFNDGEVRVEIEENVRGADVFIICSTQPPAENFLELAFLTEAAHDSSAGRITIIPTYLGYNRQDRKDKPRLPVSAHIMIDFLARRGADRVLLFDMHSPVTAGFFKPHVVVDQLYSSYVSIPHLKKMLKNPFALASPDVGGGSRVRMYARHLGQRDFVIFDKNRPEPGEVDAGGIKIVGDVEGKDILFIDDMVDSAGTVVAGAVAAVNAGAKDIYVCATHAVLSRGAVARLDDSPIKEVVLTNTIYHNGHDLRSKRVKITVLPMAPLLGQAIHRIHENQSISSLILGALDDEAK
jgi:ribose-phosphate pyrophosphokinase